MNNKELTIEEEESIRQERARNTVAVQWLQAVFYLTGIGAFIKYLFTNEPKTQPSGDPTLTIIVGAIALILIIAFVIRINKKEVVKQIDNNKEK